jgi:hypothetical protein
MHPSSLSLSLSRARALSLFLPPVDAFALGRYVPLGGNMKQVTSPLVAAARKLFNIALVFTFVAVWHDQRMQLIAWGGVLILCMIPEMLAEHVVGLPRCAACPLFYYYGGSETKRD